MKSRPKPLPSRLFATDLSSARRGERLPRHESQQDDRHRHPDEGHDCDNRPPCQDRQQQVLPPRGRSPFPDRRRNYRCRAVRARLSRKCSSPGAKHADAARSIRRRRGPGQCRGSEIRMEGPSPDIPLPRRKSPASAPSVDRTLAISLSPGTCKPPMVP